MKAYFNDGKTSKRRDCEIDFHPDKLIITYENDESLPETTEWELSQIHKIDVRTTSTTLKYGEYPEEVLELASQQDLDTIIAKYPEEEFHKSTYNTFVSFGWKGLVALVAGVVVISLLFFFYGAPTLAEGFARSIPEEYEAYIGQNVRESYLQYHEIDYARSNLIQDFYEELGYESKYDIEIVVVDSDVANAFALPGGSIVVFSGILDMIEKEDELAALLAHEVSHINGRHSLRTLSRNLSTYLLLSILTGDVGGFSSVIVENSDLISSLSFSRGLEKEADLSGISLMMESEINPRGMVNLFKKFQHLGDSISNEIMTTIDPDTTRSFPNIDTAKSWRKITWERAEQLLSTHPSPDNRIEYLESELQDFSISEFQTRNALQGLFVDIKKKVDKSLQEIIKFTEAIEQDPDNKYHWVDRGDAYLDTDDYSNAIKDFQQSINLDENYDYAIKRLGDCYYYQEEYEKAISLYNRALTIDPEYKYALLRKGLSYGALNESQEAIEIYEQLAVIYPDYSTAYGNIGWEYYKLGEYDKCIEFSNKAIELNEEAAYAMFNIALSTLRLGKIDEAKKMYSFYKDYCDESEIEIADGIIQDLRDLRDQNLHVDEVNFIIDEIFQSK